MLKLLLQNWKSINIQAVIKFLQNCIKQAVKQVSVIHKLLTTVWYKEELPDQGQESIIVPIHKMGDKTDCNNYHAISLLSTSYNILSNILLSWLSPYINEIIGDH
jgi:hypothetical protein